ncbi:hypothetical protein MBRA_18050 [Mycobacterium branderi]|uniref:DUF732 domain-containing protein n=2 Tax=Mycobacterium branderi TaxID=43348 RepID=A0ABN6B1R9_9MYCO|nr:hypothetical protein MBRA_18050 [Mycobacterium branderi]
MRWSNSRIGGADGKRGELMSGSILPMKVARLAPVAAIAVAIGLAAPAHADPDTDFNYQINGYGIYGPHDYNPYIAKIACRRLGDGVDPDAAASARFLSHNLPRGTTQVQTYQFLGSAISFYCPDLAPKLQNIPGT